MILYAKQKKKNESKKEIIFFKDSFSSIWSLTIFQVQIKLANLYYYLSNYYLSILRNFK